METEFKFAFVIKLLEPFLTTSVNYVPGVCLDDS